MDNNISVKPEDQGKNMRLAFEYIQQIFRETSQLMKQLDSYMGKDWIPTYGNRTTSRVLKKSLNVADVACRLW